MIESSKITAYQLESRGLVQAESLTAFPSIEAHTPTLASRPCGSRTLRSSGLTSVIITYTHVSNALRVPRVVHVDVMGQSADGA